MGAMAGQPAAWPAVCLGQSNVFGLNDLEDVRIIQDDVFEAFAGNFNSDCKAIGKDGGIERCAVMKMENVGVVKVGEVLYLAFAGDFYFVP